MSEMLRAAIVRVRRESDQQVIGVGFLVDAGKKTILTCAHVVNAAIGDSKNQARPRSLITLDFPFIDTEKRFDARVTHFFPKKADNTDDIAVLEILDDLPADARAVQLATADTFSSHEFSVYGFPQGFEEDGQYVEGKLQERLVNKRIQAVGTSNFGHFVEEGFSGGPVYDKDLGAVVGMMMAIADEREKRVAYIQPIDDISESYFSIEKALAVRQIRIQIEQFTQPPQYVIYADDDYSPKGIFIVLSVKVFNESETDIVISDWQLNIVDLDASIHGLSTRSTLKVFPSHLRRFKKANGSNLKVSSNSIAEFILLSFEWPFPDASNWEHFCKPVLDIELVATTSKLKSVKCFYTVSYKDYN